MDRSNVLCIFFFILFVIIQIELFLMLSLERNHLHTLSFLRYQLPEEVFHETDASSFSDDGTTTELLEHQFERHDIFQKPMPKALRNDEGKHDGKLISILPEGHSSITNNIAKQEQAFQNNDAANRNLVDKAEVIAKEQENSSKKIRNNFVDVKHEDEVVMPPLQNQKKILLNFAHGCCKKAQRKNAKTGRQKGFDIAHEYSMNDLDDQFREKNKKVLGMSTGGGYWLWKPYLILKAMEEAEWGDIIIYTDAGSHWYNRPDDRLVSYANDPDLHVCNRPYSCAACTIDHPIPASSPELLEKCGQEVVDRIRGQDVHVWDVGLKETSWTKRDIFVALDADREPYTTTSQMSAHIIMVKKSPSSMQFLKDWLNWGTDPAEYITDKSSKAQNFKGFRSNRHDQSLLSVLYKKYGYSPNPYPSSDWLVHDRDHS